jgi:hypothetical protein
MSRFRIVGLDPTPFAQLFELSDRQLAEIHAHRRVADESPGYPCRISLEDAAVGEELLLLPHWHQDVPSPYRASGPIFVRRGARAARLAPGELPAVVKHRLMSLRAYDAAHMMVEGLVCEGRDAAVELERLFGDDQVSYVHLHNARQGCFSCRALRA